MSKNSKMFRYIKSGAAGFVFLAAVGWTGASGPNPIDLGSTALAAVPAAALSGDQIASIQTAVQTAIANVNPSLTGAAREQAIAQAIAQVTRTEISIYGAAAISVVTSSAITAGVPAAQVIAAVIPAAVGAGVSVSVAVADVVLGAVSAGASPTQVAEAVIATTTQLQYASSDVGAGLGLAAATLSSTNPSAATQIAQVVANEGPAGMGQSFASSVITNGGSQQLADAGTQSPTAAAETNAEVGTGNNGQPSGNGSQGTGGTVLPTCSNPSCT